MLVFNPFCIILLQQEMLNRFICRHGCHILPVRMGHLRYASHIPVTRNSKTSTESQKVKLDLVYRFPYILPVRFVTRFKIYQTALTVAIVPMILKGVESGDVAVELANAVGVAAFMALGTLYYISNITRKLVCLIGIDKDKNNVQLSRMTFWGNRRDVIVPRENLIPLTELAGSYKDIYVDIKTYNNAVHLYLPLRFGGIHNLEDFEYIFGNLRN